MTGAAATALSYLAAFAGADPEAIAAHVTDDFRNEHTSALASSSTGRAEYLRRLPVFLTAFRDLRYDVERVIEDGDVVAVAYRMAATNEGHPVEVRGIMVLDIADGLISRRTDYWDSLGFLQQIGAEPARPN